MGEIGALPSRAPEPMERTLLKVPLLKVPPVTVKVAVLILLLLPYI